jgi:hypothetical protein
MKQLLVHLLTGLFLDVGMIQYEVERSFSLLISEIIAEFCPIGAIF